MTASRTTIEDSKVPSLTFSLPGGYILKTSDGPVLLNEATVHELTGEEEDIIADESMSESQRMQALVGSCLTRLSDGGDVVITDEKKLKKAPAKLLMADIVTSVLRIREASVGSEHRQKVRCPNPDCKNDDGKRTAWTAILNLSEFKGLPVDGDPMNRDREYTTTRGRVVEWEMMSGESEAKADKMKRGNKDKPTIALMARVKTIDGEEATKAMLKKLASSERHEIRKQFDCEGGVETDFDCLCKECDAEFKASLEVGGADFFFPSETLED